MFYRIKPSTETFGINVACAERNGGEPKRKKEKARRRIRGKF